MTVKGKHLMGGMLVFAVLFGVAMWYAQNYAWYQVTRTDDYPIALTPLAGGEPVQVPAGDFTILDASTSPLKFRACFRIGESLGMLTETFRTYEGAEPLTPPAWFDCFDPARIEADLKAGRAVAFLGQRNFSDGVDRVIAVYPDGRAYAWNHLNEKYTQPDSIE